MALRGVGSAGATKRDAAVSAFNKRPRSAGVAGIRSSSMVWARKVENKLSLKSYALQRRDTARSSVSEAAIRRAESELANRAKEQRKPGNASTGTAKAMRLLATSSSISVKTVAPSPRCRQDRHRRQFAIARNSHPIAAAVDLSSRWTAETAHEPNERVIRRGVRTICAMNASRIGCHTGRICQLLLPAHVPAGSPDPPTSPDAIPLGTWGSDAELRDAFEEQFARRARHGTGGRLAGVCS